MAASAGVEALEPLAPVSSYLTDIKLIAEQAEPLRGITRESSGRPRTAPRAGDATDVQVKDDGAHAVASDHSASDKARSRRRTKLPVASRPDLMTATTLAGDMQ